MFFQLLDFFLILFEELSIPLRNSISIEECQRLCFQTSGGFFPTPPKKKFKNCFFKIKPKKFKAKLLLVCAAPSLKGDFLSLIHQVCFAVQLVRCLMCLFGFFVLITFEIALNRAAKIFQNLMCNCAQQLHVYTAESTNIF